MTPTLTTSERVLKVELEKENDGRWIAAVPELPGVMQYGATQDEAFRKVRALALHVLAEQSEDGNREVPTSLRFSVA